MTTTGATSKPLAQAGVDWRSVLRAVRPVLVYAVLIAFALAMITPFIFSIANSIKTLPDIQKNPTLLYPTAGISTEGYQKILRGDFLRWLFNSALVSIVIMGSHLIFDSMYR